MVGTLRLRADRADEAREVIASVVEHTHREPGCLTYAAHEVAGEPLTLVVIEKWASRQHLDDHNAAPWLADAFGRAGELLTGAPEIQVLTPLGYGTAGKAALR
ncbi:Antibiotic biosynthesis monooxygenase OS=Streptomyces fumanus OX=67302 GN=GCM10018772_55480 PE=4 SV=1 [Streptomyces fumanus]